MAGLGFCFHPRGGGRRRSNSDRTAPRLSMSPPAFLPPATPRNLHASAFGKSDSVTTQSRKRERKRKADRHRRRNRLPEHARSGMRANRIPRRRGRRLSPLPPPSSHRSCDLGHLFQARSRVAAREEAGEIRVENLGGICGTEMAKRISWWPLVFLFSFFSVLRF